jgi:hypothetical protein
MAKRFSELPAATILNEDDIFAITQSLTSKKLTGDLAAQFVLRNSDYADVISTQSSNKDYAAADLEPDNRIFADSTSADITLGFFNGSDRDGTRVTVINIASANNVNIELVSDGTTDYILNASETIEFLWDDTSSKWQIVTKQLNGAFDIIVNSQKDFESAVERIAANQYKFKDSITTIYFDFAGGLLMSGTLSGGDSWGYLQTNNAKRLVMNPLTYIDFGQTQGYIEINTSNAVLENIEIRGDKGSAVAAQRSFLLNANYVSFLNCVTQKRLVNTDFAAFEGSSTGFHNDSSFYFNCKVFDIDQNGAFTLSAFKGCKNIARIFLNNMENTNASGSISLLNTCTNIVNTLIRGIDSAGNSTLKIYESCVNIDNFSLTDIDFVTGGSGSVILFDTCTNVKNGKITDIDIDDNFTVFSTCINVENIDITAITGTGAAIIVFAVDCVNFNNLNIANMTSSSSITIFSFTNIINNINIDNITSSGSSVTIAGNCNIINNIIINDLESNSNCIIFTSSNYINNIEVGTVIAGNDFKGGFNCGYVNNYLIKSITATNDIYGFESSTQLDNCRIGTSISTTNTVYGFYICSQLSNCSINSVNISGQVYGFNQCNILSNCSISSINISGQAYGFYNSKEINTCFANNIQSSGNTVYGFSLCTNISDCIVDTLSYTGAGAINSYGLDTCSKISSCTVVNVSNSGTGTAWGFNGCAFISSSLSSTNEIGYYLCDNIGDSHAINNSITGFLECNELSSCRAASNTQYGYETCNQITACKAQSNTLDGFNGCRGMTANYATGNSVYGFNDCRRMGFNRSNGNTTGQYNLCYADTGTTYPVTGADTPAEGFNTTA